MKLVTLLLFATLCLGYGTPGSYLNWGNGIDNNDYIRANNNIRRCNVANLQLFCSFNATGFISDKATLYNGIAYFTDIFGSAGSYLYAYDYEHCILKYQSNIPAQVGFPVYSRSTPALDPDTGLLIIGSWPGGYVWAFNMSTGVLVWSTLVNNHTAAEMTTSATIYNGVVYIGVSSGEESSEACGVLGQCSFKGTFHALSLISGAIIWTHQTCPGVIGVIDGFAGNAVWGSSPSIDPTLGLVFIATGNNYIVPASVTACTAAGNLSCTPSSNEVDSVVALRLSDGSVAWSQKFAEQFGYDVWTLACVVPGLQFACPPFAGNDSDFGQMPMLGVVRMHGRPIDAMFIGQKSGFVSALRRDTGALLWSTYTGVGNAGGGIVFSQASDKKRIYFGNANYINNNVTLVDGTNTTSGFWMALDKDTGVLKWETPEPNNNKVYGPMTVTEGLLFSGSMSSTGSNLFALNSATGEILWQVLNPGSQFAAPTIDHDYLMVGSGYSPASSFVPSTQFFVYKLAANFDCIDMDDEE